MLRALSVTLLATLITARGDNDGSSIENAYEQTLVSNY